MKILFVCNHISTGGINSAMLNFFSILKDKGHELTLISTVNDLPASGEAFSGVKTLKGSLLLEAFFSSASALIKERRFFLFLLKALGIALARVFGYFRIVRFFILLSRKKKESFDIAISYSNDMWSGDGTFYGGSNFYTEKKIRARKKIAWIHAEPEFYGLNRKRALITYRAFDNIVNVSFAVKGLFDAVVPEYAEKSRVVYNFFNIGRIKALSLEKAPAKDSRFRLVTVARIDNFAKRIDRALKTAKLLRDAGRDFCWHIVGDGSDLPAMKKLCRELFLEESVVFHGNLQNPYPVVASADLYVMTSDHEAYPMVLGESMICSTVPLITRIHAAKEIITDGENGFIAEKSEDSLFEKISYCMDNPAILGEIKSKLSFSNEKALVQWEELLA